MRFTLTNIALRPFKTAKKILQLLKSVELVPVVHATKLEKGWEKTADSATVFTRIDSTHLLIPFDVYKQIEPHIFRLDYDYVGSTKHWKLHDEQRLSVQTMHRNDLTAMQVAKKLEG